MHLSFFLSEKNILKRMVFAYLFTTPDLGLYSAKVSCFLSLLLVKHLSIELLSIPDPRLYAKLEKLNNCVEL